MGMKQLVDEWVVAAATTEAAREAVAVAEKNERDLGAKIFDLMAARPDITAQGDASASACVRGSATAAIVRLAPHWREYLRGDAQRLRHEAVLIEFVPEWPEY